jgi:hypothetical protein
MLLPNVTNDVIPLLKSISIRLKVSMLTPSFKTLDAF